jgi:hypothetical protein
MHVHMPKPLHGWREFVGEVGIIVVGVLIALGAEQAVEKLHERSVAEDARSAIKTEFDNDLAALARRKLAEGCIDRRLGELQGLLATWARTGRFVTPRWIGAPPVTAIELTRYDAAVSAGRLALLGSDEQYRMGAIAQQLRIFSDTQYAERQVWGRLRALSAGADALSTADRAQLRIALQDALTLDYGARLWIQQTLPRAREFGFRPDLTIYHQTFGRIMKDVHAAASICTPMQTPAAQAEKNLVTPMPL